ncbi:MAG: hypothetical protein QM485_12200 [Flavobacteriaceae bacterium]
MKNIFSILFVCVLSFQFTLAQTVSSHQYRKVAPEDMGEYLKRETTYWKTWAEAEVKKGNLTFWGIFQRVGGTDQENSPNILIINTFKDIDKGADWSNIAALFPDVKKEDRGTWALSKNTDKIFVRDLNNHTVGSNVDPENDFNFVKIIYHNVKRTGQHLKFEAKKWKPMIQKAMNEGKTSMKGWGNARIIAPRSSEFPYTIYTYDLFSSLHEALSPTFVKGWKFPEGLFDGVQENTAGPRNVNIYRAVAVVTPGNN